MRLLLGPQDSSLLVLGDEGYGVGVTSIYPLLLILIQNAPILERKIQAPLSSARFQELTSGQSCLAVTLCGSSVF